MSSGSASGTPTRPRVFIDGMNLALAQGTGVATYGRNLSWVQRQIGCQTGILFGQRAASPFNPLLREVTFFDELPPGGWPWLRTVRSVLKVGRTALLTRPKQVPLTGQVIAPQPNWVPRCDEVWNTPEVFQRANLHHALFKMRLQVRMADPPDLMHWTYPMPLAMSGARNIYTLHDLVPLRLPYTTLDNKRRYLRLHKRLVHRADHIVTVSESSRRDIISLLGVPEDRVTNTYQSVYIRRSLREAPLEQAHAEITGSFGLQPGAFYLFFGAIEPKKNVGRLIQAFLASGVEGQLVILGKKAWKSDTELRLLFDDHIRTLVLDGTAVRTWRKIILLDYAPQRLLVNLVRSAKAVLFPSLYEGFGLPALEAMLLGTPVITSNTASMPEVVGDAALTVDPYNISALAQAIRAVDADPELRARLAAAGPPQAALFSPERHAERLQALYARLGVMR